MLNRPSLQRILGFRSDGASVVDHLGAFPVEYDASSEIGGALFTTGTFEEADIRFFEELLSEMHATLVIDIGANLGLHAMRWARACPRARVYAFEPAREASALLRRNVERNDLGGRVEVVTSAIADSVGPRTFFAYTDDAYGSLRDTRRKRVTETYEVPATTVDMFVSERSLSRVDLIKIDVEGLEREVLRGARSTLAHLRPHLFVEVYGGTHSNPDPEATIADVVALGYRAWVLDQGLPRPYVHHEDRFYNYYFEPPRD